MIALFENAVALFLLGVGAVLTVRTRFTFWNVPALLGKTVFDKNASRGAFFCALSGTLGIGNIVGVGRAVQIGGPGAVFWIFVCAFLSAAVKSAEIFAARTQTKKRRVLQTVLLLIVAALMGTMAQSNAVVSLLKTDNTVLFFIVSALLSVSVFLFLSLKKQDGERVLSTLTPLMAGLYLLGTGGVILFNLSRLPAAAISVFTEAFCPRAAVGGISIGAVMQTVRAGCINGLFSHEAGLGSAPLAHTSGKPETECLFGAAEVYADSVLVSGLTAFCLLTSGQTDVAEAFGAVYGPFGHTAAVIIIAVFAVSSILCWAHYAYVLTPSPLVRVVGPLLCFVGVFLPSDAVWQAATLSVSVATAVNLRYLCQNVRPFIDTFRRRGR